MGKYLIAAMLVLPGCSLVQWLPTSSCEYVEYLRVGDQVTVKAECRV